MKIRTVVAVLLAVVALWFLWPQGDSPAIDYYQFWVGAELARTAENFYSFQTWREQNGVYLERALNVERSPRMAAAAGARNELELYSTPFLYTTFGALNGFGVFGAGYERDFLIFRVITLLTFCGGVILLARLAGLSWAAAALLLAFLFTFYQPLAAELRVANVNSLQLIVVAVALWLARGEERWRATATGALFAAFTAFKPNFIFIVPLLLLYRLVTRDRARLLWETIGAAGGAAFAVLASTLYFRAFPWPGWVRMARALWATPLSEQQGNISPALPLSMSAGPFSTYVLAIGLVVMIAAALVRRRDARADAASDATMTVVGLALVVYLIASRLVWLHYPILALPAAIALIGDRVSMIRKALGIFGLTLVGFDLWGHLMNIRTVEGQSHTIWLGLAVLFVTSLWRLWDIRTAAPAAASQESDDRRRTRTRTRSPRAVR